MARLAGLRRRADLFARYAPWTAFLLGALQSLAFAPFDLWLLGPACLALLWLLWTDVTPVRAAAIGFGFGAGLFLAGTYWLYTSIHVFGKAPLALAILLMLGLVAIMGAYTAVVGWLVARYAPARGHWRELAVLPAAWVLLEWFRGWFLSGFPWLAVGYSQLDTPLAGYAPLVGIYGVSLAATLTAGALVAALDGRRGVRALPLALVAVLWAGGFGLARIDWTRPSGAPLTVAIVQGAIPQDLKWLEDNREHTLEVYRSLTQQALGARLVVWPESALPMLYHEAVPVLGEIYRDARAKGSDLLLGLVRYDFESGQVRNGLVALGDEEEWYYKRRLVPFGEFFPVPPFSSRLDAPQEPRLRRLHGGRRRPGSARRRRPEARRDDLLRGRLRRRAARGAQERLAARQRQQRRLVRRLDGPAPAPADHAHARARGRALDDPGDQQRYLGPDRPARPRRGAQPAVRARSAEGQCRALCRADPVRGGPEPTRPRVLRARNRHCGPHQLAPSPSAEAPLT